MPPLKLIVFSFCLYLCVFFFRASQVFCGGRGNVGGICGGSCGGRGGSWVRWVVLVVKGNVKYVLFFTK